MKQLFGEKIFDDIVFNKKNIEEVEYITRLAKDIKLPYDTYMGPDIKVGGDFFKFKDKLYKGNQYNPDLNRSLRSIVDGTDHNINYLLIKSRVSDTLLQIVSINIQFFLLNMGIIKRILKELNKHRIDIILLQESWYLDDLSKDKNMEIIETVKFGNVGSEGETIKIKVPLKSLLIDMFYTEGYYMVSQCRGEVKGRPFDLNYDELDRLEELIDCPGRPGSGSCLANSIYLHKDSVWQLTAPASLVIPKPTS